MNMLDEIVQRLGNLPTEKLAQVLAYVSGLESQDDSLDDLTDWSVFSLAHACEGLEDDGPEYTLDDVVERYS